LHRHGRIEEAIADGTRTRAPDAAMTALQAAGVARGYWQPIDRPFLGDDLQSSAEFREEGRRLAGREGFASG
jgi:hypothetical protein